VCIENYASNAVYCIEGIDLRSANLNQIGSLVDENGGFSPETALVTSFSNYYFRILFGWLSYFNILSLLFEFKRVFMKNLLPLICLSAVIGVSSFDNSVQAQGYDSREMRKKYGVGELVNGYAIVTQKKGKRLKGVVDTNGKFVIKPKHKILLGPTSCGTVMTGDAITAPYDAEGPVAIGIADPLLIDIASAKQVGSVPYSVMYATGTSVDYVPNRDVVNITSGGRHPVGLYNLCSGPVLTPSFETMSKFSKKGFAIAFTKTEYTFLNLAGEERLPERLPHSLLRSDGKFRFSEDGIDPTLVLENEYWPLKAGNGKFGLFNLATQTMTIPAEYESLAYQRRRVPVGNVYKDRAVATLAEKDGRFGVLENETGAVIAPIVFLEPPTWEREFQGNYIFGIINAENATGKMANAYESEKQSFVLPNNFEALEISKYNDLWLVSQNTGPDNFVAKGLYDTETRSWAVKPEADGFISFVVGKNNTIKGEKRNGDSIFFDQKGNIVSMQPALESELVVAASSERTPVQAENGALKALSCDHKMFERKPNVAKSANISVSSTYCVSGDCYDKKRVIDDDRSTQLGPNYSWANDGAGPKWLEMAWRYPVKDMEQLYFVFTEGYIVGSYDITIKTTTGWRDVVSVRNNRELKPCHRFEPVDVLTVRIEGVGPDHQKSYMRINEAVVR